MPLSTASPLSSSTESKTKWIWIDDFILVCALYTYLKIIMLKISIVSNRVLRWFWHSKPKKRYILKIFLYHVYITSSYITHIVGTAPNTTIRHTFRNLNLSIFQYNYVSQVYLGPLRYEVLLGSRKYQIVKEGEDV